MFGTSVFVVALLHVICASSQAVTAIKGNGVGTVPCASDSECRLFNTICDSTCNNTTSTCSPGGWGCLCGYDTDCTGGDHLTCLSMPPRVPTGFCYCASGYSYDLTSGLCEVSSDINTCFTCDGTICHETHAWECYCVSDDQCASNDQNMECDTVLNQCECIFGYSYDDQQMKCTETFDSVCLSSGDIAGICVGVIVGVILLIGLTVFIMKRQD